MKKVLIFTYLQRHFKKMLPLIKKLEKDKRIRLMVLLMTKEEQALAQANRIKYKMLDEFTHNKRSRDFDLGWGLEPLINAIDKVKPDLFVAIEVNYILRNAVRYCKQLGIPNLVIQHGTPNGYSLHAFVPFEGDCFAAWGDFSKDFLIKHGLRKGKIIVTGGINFDRTLLLIPNKKKIAKILGINPNKKWIVFTTQGIGAGGMPTKEEICHAVRETAKSARKRKDCQLIFQVHPGQKIKHIQDLIDQIKNNNSKVVKYKDTEELIASSDAVITFFSTTAIDAIILTKPLLLINLSDDKDFLPFVKMGAALGAYSKEEIASSFDKLLAIGDALKTRQKKAAGYVNYKNDGKALERVMNLCYKRM